MFDVQIIPTFSLKCSHCGAQLMRDQSGVYSHLYGSACGNTIRVHIVVDEKGFIKIEKF